MKKKSFKMLLVGILVSAIVLTFAGCSGGGAGESDTTGEETYELKFAHVVNPNTPKGQAAEMFKDLVEEKSEGKITVSIYPDSQMGADQEINEQITSGTLDMGIPFFSTVTSTVGQFELFDLPFLFEDFDQANAALNGELGEKFNEYLEEKGFVGLGYQTGGFKQITNSKRPVKSVKDLDGLKIRVSQSPLLVTQYQAINAGGISVPFSDLYSSLQTKTVDGQENPYSNIATKKFYEVQDYMTVTDHGFMGYAFIMNKNKLESLPEDLQIVVKDAATEASEWEWEETKKTDEKYLQEIKDAGVTIDEFGPEEKEEFKEATNAAYEEFANTEDGQELMDIVEQYKK